MERLFVFLATIETDLASLNLWVLDYVAPDSYLDRSK